METRNIFENLSCIDHRYALSEADAFAGLSKYISEEAAIRSTAKCEAALVKAHLKIRGELTDEIAKELGIAEDLIFPFSSETKFNLDVVGDVLEESLNLTIAPTTNCNFGCPYCYEGEKKSMHMSKNILIKEILSKNSS